MLPLQLSSSCVVQCCTSSGAWLMVLAKATPPQDRLMRWEWDHLQHAPGSQKKSIKREANITKLKECWHMLTLVLAMHSLLLGSCWFQETARALRIPLHWHSLKQHWESSQADMFLRALDPSQASCRVVIHGRITDIPQTPLASIAAAPHQQPLLAAWCASDLCHVRIPWWDFSGLSTPSHLWEHPACPRKLSLKKIVILTIPMEWYATTVQFALKTRRNQMKSRWFRTSTRFMLPSASTAHN